MARRARQPKARQPGAVTTMPLRLKPIRTAEQSCARAQLLFVRDARGRVRDVLESKRHGVNVRVPAPVSHRAVSVGAQAQNLNTWSASKPISWSSPPSSPWAPFLGNSPATWRTMPGGPQTRTLARRPSSGSGMYSRSIAFET